MRVKPKGAKFRNLYAWRGLIWYSRMVRGRRYRVNTDTPISRAGWDEAAESEGGDGTRTRSVPKLRRAETRAIPWT